MLRSPLFKIVIVLVIALGVGVNAAIFSLVNAALIRPLPLVREPNQLVEIFTGTSAQPYTTTSYPDYLDYKNQNKVFSGLLAYSVVQLNLNAGGSGEMVLGELVSGNYFQVLGVNVIAGRTLLPDDDETPGGSPVAVIGYDLWHHRFGADPSLPGKSIAINGSKFTIVGIAPKGFIGTDLGFTRQLWIPMMMQAQAMPGSKLLDQRGANWLNVMGRLTPGAGLQQAQAEMKSIVNQLSQAYPITNKTRIVTLAPSSSAGIPPASRAAVIKTARIAMAIAGLVLLISCANVASLLLLRSISRRKEVAIRLAVGASRARIVRQLLTESVMVSLMGGSIGLMLALWASRLLLWLSLPFVNPKTFNVGLDWRVFTFALVISILSGVFFGLAPALQIRKPSLLTALKNDVESHTVGRFSLNTSMVAFQIALSLVLIITAGLFVRSLVLTQGIHLGFDTQNVVVMPLDLRLNGYAPEEGKLLYQQLVERIDSMPGVESVSLTNIVPLSGSGNQTGIMIPGFNLPPGQEYITIDNNFVGPKYFATMGIPLIKGRDFNLQDVKDSPQVVIINQAMARGFWANEDPIGKEFKSVRGVKHQVVGMVSDSKYRDLWTEPAPLYYLPFLQRYNSRMNLLARTTGDPQQTLASLQREVHELDKGLPVTKATELRQDIARLLDPQRTAMILSSAFSTLSLLLAVLGLYGVVAYSVSQREREISIRMALGAQRHEVISLIVKRGMMPVFIGVPAGVITALLLSRFIEALLYGVSVTDPITFVAGAVGLTLIAILASYIPATRAARVDPVTALRRE